MNLTRETNHEIVVGLGVIDECRIVQSEIRCTRKISSRRAGSQNRAIGHNLALNDTNLYGSEELTSQRLSPSRGSMRS